MKLSYAAWFGYLKKKSLLHSLIKPEPGCFGNGLFEFSKAMASSKSGTVSFPVSLVVMDWWGEAIPFCLTQSMTQKPLEVGYAHRAGGRSDPSLSSFP